MYILYLPVMYILQQTTAKYITMVPYYGVYSIIILVPALCAVLVRTLYM